MSTARAIRFGAALAVIGLLAACSGNSRLGNTQSSAALPSSESSATATGAAGGVPRVSSPLPTQALVSDPCTAISSAQLNQLSVAGTGKQGKLQDGTPNCTWSSATSAINLIKIAPGSSNQGLAAVYANKGMSAYFEPTTIDGYPAVYADSRQNGDLRAKGACGLFIGVTDQVVVNVSTSLGEGQYHTNPCPIAARFGQAMIEHLKGAA
ncbi:DUF3558 domain-containing protein [Amycolatopsis cynarae]|uniref:DUF3558 domain-containing protein n=1 Tax=Amycolatopsis cynarae TaxID=2995223 RepID=A0ABY7B340_9PSEU|nr:DUF3558 domain-containing protein [Amycolatopsis sp. HUAS 11-8]WAL65653.1 DUF3558 domain-containing protein [Amycolatopsis sp. HUAS 11-8]